MKKITKLTDKSIFKLTDENLEEMIRLEMAEQGIPILIRPEEPKYSQIPNPDMKVYWSNIFGDKVVYTNIEELQTTISKALSSEQIGSLQYNSTVGYEVRFFKQGMEPEGYISSRLELDQVKSMSVYSQELFNEVSKQMILNKKAKAKYDSDMKGWQKVYDQANDIRTEIYDTYHDACGRIQSLESYKSIYTNQYLPLAPNDPDTAVKFFRKAFQSVTDQDMKEIDLVWWQNNYANANKLAK